MTESPNPSRPGSDWLASVAAENQQRDDELERLRARVAELEIAFDGMKSPPGSDGWKWLNRFNEEDGISQSTWRDMIARWFEHYHRENETLRAENEQLRAEKLLEVNRRRKKERDALKSRVAELEQERDDLRDAAMEQERERAGE